MGRQRVRNRRGKVGSLCERGTHPVRLPEAVRKVPKRGGQSPFCGVNHRGGHSHGQNGDSPRHFPDSLTVEEGEFGGRICCSVLRAAAFGLMVVAAAAGSVRAQSLLTQKPDDPARWW